MMVNKRELSLLFDVDERSLSRWQNLALSPLPVEEMGKRGASNLYDVPSVGCRGIVGSWAS